jgi:hypothetical protein
MEARTERKMVLSNDDTTPRGFGNFGRHYGSYELRFDIYSRTIINAHDIPNQHFCLGDDWDTSTGVYGE